MRIQDLSQPMIGDIVEFEIDTDTVVEGVIIGETDDGYIYEFSQPGLDCIMEDAAGYIPKNSQEAKDPRWSTALTQDVTTHTMRDQIRAFYPTKPVRDGQQQVKEATYQGREVPLGRPMRGDVKKFKVYVRNKAGKVVKVNFGDPNMRIKKSNPKRRKSFRARHRCDTPGPRWKARYWSCRKW
jgi:hypothetical protein